MAALDHDELKAYFERIGYSHEGADPPPPTVETLKPIHVAHAQAIPFENLSMNFAPAKKTDPSGGIKLDIPSIVEKVVTRRRGGYCFETNNLFAAALRACGFKLYTAAAKVVVPNQEPSQDNPDHQIMTGRIHCFLLVHMEEAGIWLADVGFGLKGLVDPIPLKATESAADAPASKAAGRHLRLRRGYPYSKATVDPHSAKSGLNNPRYGWYLQIADAFMPILEWKDEYWFTEEEHFPDDLDMYHYHTSNELPFFKNNIAGMATPEGHVTLFNDRLKVINGATGDVDMRMLESEEDIVGALKQHFGIELAAC